MFGFLIGAACLGGLIALGFHRPRHHFGWHHGFGRHHGFGGGRFQRDRFFLNAAFERLDTTPGQEKAIMAAISDLRDNARSVREKLRGSRGEVAAAFREEEFQEDRVRAAVERHTGDLVELTDTAAQTLAKIHEALDAEQRERLARWLESGRGAMFA
jgi:Spy/CpxP family protein refolding chaperone